MQRKEFNGIEWLEFELLADIPNLIQGVFLRNLGVGKNNPQSFKSFSLLDSFLYKRSGFKCSIHHLHQVHGNIVRVIDNDTILEGDSMVTCHPFKALLIKHADCQAAIFYDPVNHVLATTHSGWRGSVANIYSATITSMTQHFGTCPENVLVGISPSLGPNSAQFIHYKKELPEAFWEFQVKPHYFDFWAISEMQLKSAGILTSHIEVARIDTFAEESDFYSYRRDKIPGMSNATMAVLI